MGQEPTRCRAEWEKYGKRAGPVRNRQMLELKPDGVVAFDTGGPGTRDMITAAQEAGVPVYLPRPSGQI
jgi:ABC-type Fe3+-hydroxamate transport system substrate-binding protein